MKTSPAFSTEPPSLTRDTLETTPDHQWCDLTVVMPCLNEAETLEKCIRKALNAIAELDIRGEVVVADNGSTDGSQEIARRAGARVVPVSTKGYGNALRGGIAAARGRWIIMGDADDSYDFASIAPFVEKLQQGDELVMGCRLPWGNGRIMKGAMPWKHRWIGNPGFTLLGKLFFGSAADDFYCGLRAFTKEVYHRLQLHAPGMEFACEMVIRASLQKVRMSQVPITLHKDGRSRRPHLRTWRDGWRTLRFMLLYCPMWLFLVPASLLITFGAVAGGFLLAGPITWGSVGFDTSTLLVCAMSVILGTQLGFFGIFARLFATLQGMLPPNRTLQNLLKVFSLERGLLGGSAMIIIGMLMMVNAVLFWKDANFGALSYPDSLRRVIPALTLVTLGAQIGFSSFLISLFSLPGRSSAQNEDSPGV